MLFARTETQAMLGDMLARLLDAENAFEARRLRLAGPAPDRLALWPLLAEQGILGAAFSEDAGGFGGTMRDLAVVMAQVGRSLAVEPVLATALCGLAAPDEIPAIIAGTRVLAIAHAESADPFDPVTTTAGGGTVSGHKPVVRDGDIAHAFIVSTATGWHSVEAGGIERTAFRLIDGSSAASLTFDGAAATALPDAPSIDDLLARYAVGLAAETVGILEALNAATFAYLRTRRQFGVALSTFQALQHRAANMFAAAEEARTLTDRAIDAIDSSAPDAAALASAAKATADTAGRLIGHDAVQLHGGMGVSDELDVSHYMRRLAAIRAELGSADAHRARFAKLGGARLPDSVDMAAWRAEVRAFVQANLPTDIADKGRKGLEIAKDDYVRWQKILRDHGWFAAAWSLEHGGAGWDLERQLVFLQEASLNAAPMVIPYGVNMVGPVLQAFGTPEQQARHLPGILSSDVWWCQGYSEPNAGSDLASLKTTAVRDGDHYVVNGTKMWTTEAHWADWMHCLVRTDSTVKAQQGISFLLIDMTTPGITVRPIVTIDGQHHTNQIFFDDVRVPAENLVAAEGQGWTIAKFLLSNERVAIADTGPKLRLLGQVKALLYAQPASPHRERMTLKLADAEIQLLTLCALEQDYVSAWAGGGSKEGPQASVLKIRGTEILQLISEIALEIEGPLGAAHDPADLHLPPATALSVQQSASAMAHQYLYGRCWSIFGGTNEIQRGLIARAVLG
ncbi:acyl-CoA dehydrogenase family protein [Novosphingobium lentum]|uniref:acyl-CoA dehydrogenase family protein n=1 Tax=Novosphingobium lentum TaxID=145287 RepID=UPI000A01233B|nr:acyl-CoA dehydrogenase family protein [Novosphingobium lentum]